MCLVAWGLGITENSLLYSGQIRLGVLNMDNRFAAFLLLAVSLSIAGCGFKSDLFLPGQPENAGQLDSDSIETLKQRSIDTLQDEDLESVESQIRGAAEDLTTTDGVPVIIEPLSNEVPEEIKKNRDKNKLP